MRTAHLDEIVRQKDPTLKSAVESLAKGDVQGALESLHRQGRIREIADAGERVRAIARSYVESPESTLIVSPDNASRRELNVAVREELKANGALAPEDPSWQICQTVSDRFSRQGRENPNSIFHVTYLK